MSSSLGITTDKDSAAVIEAGHLRTDHLLHNIGRRAVSGGFVTVGAQAAKFVLNFTAAAVLARLLSPRDFGLVGMVLGVTALVGIFNVLGLSTVMELFTLGEGHYTEKDITEAARALTGWSLDRPAEKFINRPMFHDYGMKTVLGRTGNLLGEEVLEQIVAQP